MPLKHRHRTKFRERRPTRRRAFFKRFDRFLDHAMTKWVVIATIFMLGVALTGFNQADAVPDEVADNTFHFIPTLATICFVVSGGALLYFVCQPRRRKNELPLF